MKKAIVFFLVVFSSYPASGQVFLSEDFDTGYPGWSWNGLWRESNPSAFCNLFTSPNRSFVYNQNNPGCNYDTGSTNSGNLDSPVFFAPVGPLFLSFQSWHNTECSACGADKREIFLSVNSGPFFLVTQLTDSTMNTWTPLSVDLTAYSGNNLQVRFAFDTGDNVLNVFQGWYLDDVQVSTSGVTAPYSEGFDGIFSGWSSGGMWHLADDGLPPGCDLYYSYPRSWWYGQDSTCNFDNTAPNAGSLFSPVISIPPVMTDAVLRVRSYWDSEPCCSYDRKWVRISVGGGPFNDFPPQVGGGGDPQYVWNLLTYDLSPYSGMNVQFEFFFDSVDATGNGGLGWFVDDFYVGSATAPTPTPTPTPTPSAVTAPYSEGFDGGWAGWAGNGFWHLSDITSPPACDLAYSPNSSWWYGQDGTCNFDNGLTNSGVLTSPVITIPPAMTDAVLRLRSFWDTESCCTYDRKWVRISVGGGPFNDFPPEVGLLDPPYSWNLLSYDLSPFNGMDVQFEFSFNSVDGGGNGGLGWFVDDFYVGSATAPTPTPSPTPGGRMFVSGITTGYAPNGYTNLANNGVAYSWANSQPALNEYAVFQDHDPWSATMITTAILGAGHTYTLDPPGNLVGFPFGLNRVVILNFDDTSLGNFEAPYAAALPDLENYVLNGGVLWIQAATQGITFPLPFGGTGSWSMYPDNFIMNTSHPLVLGMSNPFFGGSASHQVFAGYPANASVLVVSGSTPGGQTTLYELIPTPGVPSPTPTITPILDIQKSVGPLWALPGSTLTYALSYQNLLGSYTTTIKLWDSLPFGVGSFVSSSQAPSFSGSVAYWDVGPLAPGNSGVLTVVFATNPGPPPSGIGSYEGAMGEDCCPYSSAGPGNKVAIRYQPEKALFLTAIVLNYSSVSGLPTAFFEVRNDDGTGLPGPTVLSTASASPGLGWSFFDFPDLWLEKGKIYHFVVYCGGGGSFEVRRSTLRGGYNHRVSEWTGAAWVDSALEGVYALQINGASEPFEGECSYQVLTSPIFQSNIAGEIFVPQSPMVVSQVEMDLAKIGFPADLVIQIRNAGNGVLAQGALPAGLVGASRSWKGVVLDAPLTLLAGLTYRIVAVQAGLGGAAGSAYDLAWVECTAGDASPTYGRALSHHFASSDNGSSINPFAMGDSRFRLGPGYVHNKAAVESEDSADALVLIPHLPFVEDFSTDRGWSYEAPEWQRGAAVTSTGNGGNGCGDPGSDHSPTADDFVAGVVLGGNARTTAHPFEWLTSPPVDTTSWASPELRFWRHLTSDYLPNYMEVRVEVFDGSLWTPLWSNGTFEMMDCAWNEWVFDLSPYSNPNLQVRFGHWTSGDPGTYIVSGWNLDDVSIGPAFVAAPTFTFTVSATPSASATPSPDISISKSGTTLSVLPGATLTYVLFVANSAGSPASGALQVWDRLPLGTADYLGSSPAGSLTGDLLNWSLGSLAPGASQSLYVVMRAKTTPNSEFIGNSWGACCTLTLDGALETRMSIQYRPSTTETLSRVYLYLNPLGPSAGLNCQVRDDDGSGHPGPTVLTSVFNCCPSPAWSPFDFPDILLQRGQNYHFVFDWVGPDNMDVDRSERGMADSYRVHSWNGSSWIDTLTDGIFIVERLGPSYGGQGLQSVYVDDVWGPNESGEEVTVPFSLYVDRVEIDVEGFGGPVNPIQIEIRNAANAVIGQTSFVYQGVRSFRGAMLDTPVSLMAGNMYRFMVSSPLSAPGNHYRIYRSEAPIGDPTFASLGGFHVLSTDGGSSYSPNPISDLRFKLGPGYVKNTGSLIDKDSQMAAIRVLPTPTQTPTATFTITPNLSLLKGATKLSVISGETFTYALIYANGPASYAVNPFRVWDTLPLSELIYRGSFPAGVQSGSMISWNLGNLSPGSSGTLAVFAEAAAGIPAALDNYEGNSNIVAGNADVDGPEDIFAIRFRPKAPRILTGAHVRLSGDGIVGARCELRSDDGTGMPSTQVLASVDLLPIPNSFNDNYEYFDLPDTSLSKGRTYHLVIDRIGTGSFTRNHAGSLGGYDHHLFTWTGASWIDSGFEGVYALSYSDGIGTGRDRNGTGAENLWGLNQAGEQIILPFNLRVERVEMEVLRSGTPNGVLRVQLRDISNAVLSSAVLPADGAFTWRGGDLIPPLTLTAGSTYRLIAFQDPGPGSVTDSFFLRSSVGTLYAPLLGLHNYGGFSSHFVESTDAGASYNPAFFKDAAFRFGPGYIRNQGALDTLDSFENLVLVVPTLTSTPTSSPTDTFTPTPTWTITASPTATLSFSPTPTWSPTATYSWTTTATETATPSWSPTETSTTTSTHTFTSTATDSPTATPTSTPTHTNTFSSTATESPTATPTATPTHTQSFTSTATDSPTATPSATPTYTPSFSSTLSDSPTASVTPTPSGSRTATGTPSPTNTWTPSPTASPSSTDTGTPTITDTATDTRTTTGTTTVTPTHSKSSTQTATLTLSATLTQTPTPHLPFSLSHNVFNPLQYQLRVDVLAPAGGRTTVDVYNMAGERVRRLKDWNASLGNPYSFAWDGRSEDGGQAGNGVYVLVMKGPAGVLVRKVILLK